MIRFKNKKISACLGFVIGLGSLFVARLVFAAPGDYVFLQKLPGVDYLKVEGGSQGFIGYLSGMFKLAIYICALLAVLMIVIGGLEYVMTEKVASKEDAKSRIENAIIGLLIALFAWILLYTINPDLVSLQAIGGGSVMSTDSKPPAEKKETLTYEGILGLTNPIYNNDISNLDFTVYKRAQLVSALDYWQRVKNLADQDPEKMYNGISVEQIQKNIDTLKNAVNENYRKQGDEPLYFNQIPAPVTPLPGTAPTDDLATKHDLNYINWAGYTKDQVQTALDTWNQYLVQVRKSSDYSVEYPTKGAPIESGTYNGFSITEIKDNVRTLNLVLTDKSH